MDQRLEMLATALQESTQRERDLGNQMIGLTQNLQLREAEIRQLQASGMNRGPCTVSLG